MPSCLVIDLMDLPVALSRTPATRLDSRSTAQRNTSRKPNPSGAPSDPPGLACARPLVQPSPPLLTTLTPNPTSQGPTPAVQPASSECYYEVRGTPKYMYSGLGVSVIDGVSKSSLACGIAYLYIDILCRRDVLGVLPRGPRVLTLACGRYGPDLAGPLVAPRGCKSQAVQQELSHA